MTIRAKMLCGASTPETATFYPVSPSTPAMAAPGGSLQITFTNPAALDQVAFSPFESGKEYMLDVSPYVADSSPAK